MKLYRVQDKDGRGPWKPGFSHHWMDEDIGHRSASCPPIYLECGIDVFLHIRPHEHSGCACKSIEQLKQWFTPTERNKLQIFGYRLVEIEADRIIAETPTQVLFARNHPLKVRARRIEWRK